MKKIVFLFAITLTFVTSSFSQKESKTTKLIDKDLTLFDIWLSIPHPTVTDLPKGTYQSEKIDFGSPIGLNNNLKHVFSVIDENGALVLKITGEIFGCISTKQTYQNYHLSTMFKWGDKKWEPRLNKKRDSGILYHCYGEHGRFWNTWKTSLEFQVQETDLGDFIPLGGNSVTPKVGSPIVEIRGDFKTEKKYNPNSEIYSIGKGYINAASEHDAPHGEWNRLELYVIGNDAVHVVNGKIVMVVENAINPETNKPLTKGEIQIQSEAAECYYKNMTITPITEFPEFILDAVTFKS
ncbi:uncharacterized protein DUF1080 [Jejuia pallidilutea]|uniref:Uncharacterized protein DUF1080 n=1 Tax=Jejuia pallidilutea TaxID=504487 RepID=A0A362XAN4_9FLAO|nr:DUF1080 domain-containing protein [Jejuia pallidilutea]PQV49406.1 uncharacterized protein DUF1080 [Jejuia pallidilutea]